MRKGLFGGILFLVIGISMFLYAILELIPTAKGATENCTLQVDAIVIENTEYSDHDADGYRRIYYNQVVEYEVKGEVHKITLHSEKADPVEIGTKIAIWVDPNDPLNMMTNPEWEPIAIGSISFSAIFFLIGLVGCVFSLKKQSN